MRGIALIYGLFFMVYLGFVSLISLWTDRSLDFWATYANDAATNVPYWVSFLFTMFLSPIVLGLNILTEVLRFIL